MATPKKARSAMLPKPCKPTKQNVAPQQMYQLNNVLCKPQCKTRSQAVSDISVTRAAPIPAPTQLPSQADGVVQLPEALEVFQAPDVPSRPAERSRTMSLTGESHLCKLPLLTASPGYTHLLVWQCTICNTLLKGVALIEKLIVSVCCSKLISCSLKMYWSASKIALCLVATGQQP